MADRQINVFIIDDNAGFAESTAEGLRLQGFTVTTAYTGGQGMKHIREHRPDLVLLDIRLPDADGLQLCREIKDDPRLSDISVILITGDEMVDVEKGFVLGADDCIFKPVDMDYLIGEIRKLVRRKPKVLVVDDDRQICSMLAMLLARHHYDVDAVYDGQSIIEVVRKAKPGLILLDISLSVPPNGVEVCKILKEYEETKKIPVIMLTASECVGDVEKSFELGAEDYVFKPFNADDLLRKIEKYLPA